MDPQKIRCRRCSALILPATAERTGGVYIPCSTESDGTISEPENSLDWLCIPISKRAEDAMYCDYIFTAALSEPDPERPRRRKVEKHHQGVLRIHKASGEVELLVPMPGDSGDRRARSAAGVIYRHWKTGKYPEQTIFAAG